MTSPQNVTEAIRDANALYNKLKSDYDGKNYTSCVDLINQLILKFLHFPTYMNPGGASKSATWVQEVMLTREVLEYAVLVAARRKALDDFALYYHQLTTYHQDFSGAEVPESQRKLLIQGLNLTRLLVENKVAELHAELEKIPAKDQSSMYIQAATRLERYLMEGSYNKLLHARDRVPSNDYIVFMEMLEETVRNEVANCMPQTYKSVSLASAQKLLMLKSEAETKKFVDGCGWRVENGHVLLEEAAKSTAVVSPETALSFNDRLVEHLQHAVEFQKVV